MAVLIFLRRIVSASCDFLGLWSPELCDSETGDSAAASFSPTSGAAEPKSLEIKVLESKRHTPTTSNEVCDGCCRRASDSRLGHGDFLFATLSHRKGLADCSSGIFRISSDR